VVPAAAARPARRGRDGLIEAGNLEGSRGAYRLVTPIDRLEIPANVHSLLSARIDRLVERDKRVLQAASVIGHEFAEPILEAVADLPRLELSDALGVLRAAEFVYEESLYPVAEYSFKHPLTQEVALKSQLRDRRRRTHAGVARALMDANPEKLDERAALLAHHWDEAGDEQQASVWHHRAAEAIGFHHLEEAMRHFRRAQYLVDRLPPTDETKREAALLRNQVLWYGLRAGIQRDEAQQLFDESMQLSGETGDPGIAAFALFAFGAYTLYCGRGPDAYPLLARAVDHADLTDDLGLRLATRWGQVLGCYFEGKVAAALTPASEGITMGADDPMAGTKLVGYEPYHLLLGMRGALLSFSGRFTEAEQDMERALQASGMTGHIVRVFVVEHCHFSGNTQAAIAQARRSVAGVEEQGGTNIGIIFSQRGLGIALTLAGEWREALQAFECSLEISHEVGTFLQAEPTTLVWVARVRVSLGEIDRARGRSSAGSGTRRRTRARPRLRAARTPRTRRLRGPTRRRHEAPQRTRGRARSAGRDGRDRTRRAADPRTRMIAGEGSANCPVRPWQRGRGPARLPVPGLPRRMTATTRFDGSTRPFRDLGPCILE